MYSRLLKVGPIGLAQRTLLSPRAYMYTERVRNIFKPKRRGMGMYLKVGPGDGKSELFLTRHFYEYDMINGRRGVISHKAH